MKNRHVSPFLILVTFLNSCGIINPLADSNSKSDTTPPVWLNAGIEHATTMESSNLSPVIEYNANATDNSSDVSYEYAIGSSNSGSARYDLQTWTPVESSTFQASDLTLNLGETYYVSMRARDANNNLSVIHSSAGWTVTASSVAPPTSLNDGYWWTSITASPRIRWAHSTNLSSLDRYEYSIGTSAGTDDIKTWTSNGLANTLETSGLTLSDGSIYFVNVRAVSNGSSFSPVVSSDGWKVRVGGIGAFDPASSLTALSNPRDVAIVDLNGDQLLDVVSSNGLTGTTISVFPGNGDGTFASREDHTVASNPQTLNVADYDKDGILDIGIAQYTSKWSVFRGLGDFDFDAKMDTTFTGSLTSSATADFDNDGFLDVVLTGTVAAHKLWYLPNNGSGVFPVNAAAFETTPQTPKTVVTGDVNNDGNQDAVLVTENGNTLTVFLGNGNGTFQAKKDFATGARPRGLVLLDVNGDNNLDAAVAEFNTDTLSVFHGNGAGDFSLAASYAAPGQPHGAVAADLNGDGILDLGVVSNASSGSGSNSWGLYLGNSDGTFQTRIENATGTQPLRLAVGDLNSDGKPDVLVANGGAGAGVGTLSMFLAD